MANYERRYRIFSSGLVLFLFFAVTWGTPWVFNSRHNGKQALIGAGIVAILYGVGMTFIMKRHLRKFDKWTGLTDPKQQWAMHNAVRTGKLPEDPEVLRAMPAYIDNRVKANQQSRRSAPIFLAVVSVANGIIAISDHSLGDMLPSVFILLLAVVLYFQATKQAKKLASLQQQLASKKH